MNTDRRRPVERERAWSGRRWRVGSLFGIDICLDASLALIFTLIVFLLGNGVFPEWHPDWEGPTRWFLAMATAVMFFVSLLAHELAHSLMSRTFGVEVKRITLLLFGGMAEIESEMQEPRAEFMVAIVGPVTSLVLGILFSILGTHLAGPDFTATLLEDRDAALASLSPLATMLLWLGPVNIVLGVFNLLPGFPLDGGRVLRALMWWLTGDLQQATRLASGAGRLFGWSLIILGILQAVSGMPLQGLWLVLIGWFLSNAASASYRTLVVGQVLEGITARDMMRSHFGSVSSQLRVADFIDNYLMQSSQLVWPVLEEENLIGLVTIEEVRKVPSQDREIATVGQVMLTNVGALTVEPDAKASNVFERLAANAMPLAVVKQGHVLGLLSAADAAKWLLLHQR